jgi:hypothetical protein
MIGMAISLIYQIATFPMLLVEAQRMRLIPEETIK